MDRNIEVTFLEWDIKKAFPEGTTYFDIAKEVQEKYDDPILIASVDNNLVELSEKIYTDTTVKFYDQSSSIGSRVYIRGILFLFIKAYKDVVGDYKLRIENSLDKGIYCEAEVAITQDMVNNIVLKMKELVDKNEKIKAVDVPKAEALSYFSKRGEKDKVDVLNFITSGTVRLYQLGDIYDYFYGEMPLNVGIYDEFDITLLGSNGMVLRFPTIYAGNEMPDYRHHEKLFDVFKENADWVIRMKMGNVAGLNHLISEGKGQELIYMAETLQNRRISKIVDQIVEASDYVKVVLIAGPSSSGKTTTSKKIAIQLKMYGFNPLNVSTDDYFVDKKDTPKDENGDYDFECLDAIDVDMFNDHMTNLIGGVEVNIPTYNFLLGKKEYHKENKIKLGKKDILIVEGIHGLNPKLTKNIPTKNKFKIYISPLTQINIDDHNKINTTDTRLLRRIVRDYKYRGYSAEETLSSWHSVRRGEEKFVFPFQDSADTILNSALIYELSALKPHVLPLLYSVSRDSEEYIEAKRLIYFLRNFLPISSEDVPKESHLREFIGGSIYQK